MNSQSSENSTTQDENSVEVSTSHSRRDALKKLAYASPAVATLFLSKSAAAQASGGPAGPAGPPSPPAFPLN